MANKEPVAENAEDKDVADVADVANVANVANAADVENVANEEDNEAAVGDVVDKKIDEEDTRGLIDCHLTYLVL
jgi:hypothetical protein